VYEARVGGADAILLIVRVLSDSQLRELLALTRELGMEALLEVHSADELTRVLPLEPRVVGVNNRNLQTFAVDFDNTARLRAQIPAGVVIVAESGLKSAADVAAMAAIGVDAVLIGETLVTSKNVRATSAALVAAGRPGGYR
jgi:indole-3-glycerol phosphate synthase